MMKATILLGSVLLLAVAGYLGWNYFKKTGMFASATLYNFELLAASTGNENQIYLAYYDRGIKADKMLAAAQAHCNETTRQLKAGFESCIIAIARSDAVFDRPAISKTVGRRELQNVMDVLAREWTKSETVDGFFILDPDNSTVRHRPDQIFVVDCAVFDEPVRSEAIICKGSERDVLSKEMSRAASKDEASVQVNDAAPDAAAAATAAAQAAASQEASAAAEAAESDVSEVVAEAVGFPDLQIRRAKIDRSIRAIWRQTPYKIVRLKYQNEEVRRLGETGIAYEAEILVELNFPSGWLADCIGPAAPWGCQHLDSNMMQVSRRPIAVGETRAYPGTIRMSRWRREDTEWEASVRWNQQ